jgi:hypothetical protein
MVSVLLVQLVVGFVAGSAGSSVAEQAFLLAA